MTTFAESTSTSLVERFLISSPHISQDALRKLARSLPKLKVVNNEPVEKRFEDNAADE